MRGFSWPPSGPFTPRDALDAVHAHARRLLRPPSRAVSHHHSVLTPRLAVATAVPDTTAPRVVSRHGPSVLPPWLVSGAAAGVCWHGASRNCSSSGRRPTAPVTRLRPCTAC